MRTPRAGVVPLAALPPLLLALCASRAENLPQVVNLADLDGARGFTLVGESDGDRFFTGYGVGGAGDLNGDGVDDFVIGAPFASVGSLEAAGICYVVFGREGLGEDGALSLDSLNGVGGFRILGVHRRFHAGIGVSRAGDLNGDGFDDLLIGAPQGTPPVSTSGEAYVLFGSPQIGAGGDFFVSQLDGKNGFTIDGRDFGEAAGFSVAGMGDFNGDGIDDIAIGAPAAPVNGLTHCGVVYIIYGGKSLSTVVSIDGVLDLALLGGESGLVIEGDGSEGNAGFSIAAVGDVNGDTFADLLIGAPFAGDATRALSGKAYLVHGGQNVGAGSPLSLQVLSPPHGVILRGAAVDSLTGLGVGAAGDVNGDGWLDIAIGAPTASPNGENSGMAHVVFGGTAAMASGLIDLAAIPAGAGFTVFGAMGSVIGDNGDLAGLAVGSTGDFNGDGVDDLYVGAPNVNVTGMNNGRVYILYGGESLGATDVIDLASFDPATAMVMNGIGINDVAGRAVAGVGDVNADGAPDVLIGAPGSFRGDLQSVGEAYIIFGRPPATADISGDGVVGALDLALLLSLWGLDDFCADLNADGVVDSGDLAILLGAWGTAS